VHGTEFNPVGDMMRLAHRDRVLTSGDVEIPWAQIADPQIDQTKRRKMVFDYVLKVMSHTSVFGIDDEPLGMIDPDPANAGTSIQSSNPLQVKGLQAGTFPISRTARFARAASDEMILVEDPSKDDYTIEGSLVVESQVK
jgi:hypothetical protein